MKKASKHREPSKESLREIPEVDFTRLRRGRRGKYAHLATGPDVHAIVIDEDLWKCFGSAKAVNDALRALVEFTAQLQGKPRRPRAKSKRAA